MTFKKSEEQSDFLEAAALQKLIVAAMKELTKKPPQEIAVLLRQIFNQYNAANSQVKSEMAELIQELQNLVREHNISIPTSKTPIRFKSKKRSTAFAFAGCTALLALSAIGLEFMRQPNIIARQSSSFSKEDSATSNSKLPCSGVNPERVAVEGYRRNGRYVAPHERTAPNNITSDNLEVCQ